MWTRFWPKLIVILCCSLLFAPCGWAQSLTGALVGTVKDGQGALVPGARVRASSPALMQRELTTATSDSGQLRFPALPPGRYALDIEAPGFTTYHETGIEIGAGATIERTVVLSVGGVAESLTVEGPGSSIEARGSGLETRFGRDDFDAIPTGRYSMFDFLRAAPGISPTSPSSATTTSLSAGSVSALGSGVNENQFLIDGTNFTCPCSGLSRAEPGVDFIQEVHVQSAGASAEFGNLQGAVINVITRDGGEKFLYDASYYDQPSALTSGPVVLPVTGGSVAASGYSRLEYRDFTTNAGGPAIPRRLWFFGGYQHLRDSDSQPGVDPALPRTYEQDKAFAKLTWQLGRDFRLLQSLHYERWLNPPPPTITTPFEATTRNQASVPAMTFAHVTHTMSAGTVWDARVARFVVSEDRPPSTGSLDTRSHTDRVTRVTTEAPQSFGERNYFRTTIKATLSHYETGLFGADHELKAGGSLERGEHRHTTVIPGGTRFVDNNGQPFQAISRDPSPDGGLSITASAFVTDSLRAGSRLTLNLGLRFDHSEAISQDLHALDDQGRNTAAIINGLGRLYTWNFVSPRLGLTAKVTSDSRTILRASYGRFSQGVLTGEFGAFHPGVTPITTAAYNPATGGYTTLVSVVDPKAQLQLDGDIRAPHSDEYSVGIDREIVSRLAVAAAYVHKRGTDFIGYEEVAGIYSAQTRPLPDGTTVPVQVLVSPTAARRFLLTNPEGFGLVYHGLVTTIEKRHGRGWRALGSYTFSRATGLQVSSGTAAAGEQLSTLTSSGTFGQDPNNLTNARGRLANDRPHAFRLMGSVELFPIKLQVAANLQHFSGKPWAASTQVTLPQGDQRILLEPPGSRRLSSQTLLDLRIAKPLTLGKARVDLMLDVLNALNESAEEALATDNRFSVTFGQPTIFVNPRRVMLGVRLSLGR